MNGNHSAVPHMHTIRPRSILLYNCTACLCTSGALLNSYRSRLIAHYLY